MSCVKPCSAKMRRAWLRAGMAAAVMAATCGAGLAQAADPAGTEPPIGLKQPPVATGVVPLPQGPPNTAPQAPLPKPARVLPKADAPLLESPRLAQLTGFSEDKPLTIQDAVSIALYTNRAFANAVAALQRAQGRTGEARAAYGPTVGVNTNVTYYDAATTAALGPASFTVQPQFFPVFQGAVTLPLDVSSVIRSAVSAAQFNEVAARIDVNRVRNQIAYDVKTAFYNALRSQAQTAVATDNLNSALTRLRDANANYSAGTAPRFDVLSAERDVADAQRTLLDVRAQVNVNLAQLKNVMGIAIGTRMTLAEQGAVEYPNGVQPPPAMPTDINAPVPAPETVVPPDAVKPAEPTAAPALNIPQIARPATDVVDDTFGYGPEYQALVDEAVKTRPEILEAEAQTAAARHGLQYARRSVLPGLSLSLQYNYTPNPAGFSRISDGAAVLGISVPIYDAGLARARVEQARADVASGEIARRQARDQVELDVQTAYIALTQARNRVAVANVGLSTAMESYRLARVRYNTGVSVAAGVSPQLELSSAQASLTLAQTNQVNALYDYNNARAQLDRALGRYSYTPNGPGYNAPPSAKVTGAK